MIVIRNCKSCGCPGFTSLLLTALCLMPGITNCFSSFPTQGEGSKARTTSPALCRSAINFRQFLLTQSTRRTCQLSRAAPVACDYRTANLISDRTSRAFVPPSTHGAQPTAALRTRFFYRGSLTQPSSFTLLLQRTPGHS